MKTFYCPVCGQAHTEVKEVPFKVKVNCEKCKTTLNVEMTKEALTVKFKEPEGDW